jgi:hypothetical protein
MAIPLNSPKVSLLWRSGGAFVVPRAMLAVACATGRASHARQVKGDDADKKGYPGPPGWGLGVRLTTPRRKKYCYETSREGQGPPTAVEPMMMMMMIPLNIKYRLVS